MPTFTQDVEAIRRRASQKIEEGPVTAGYRGDVDRTIDILNEALATEIVCVLRYMHHYFMATGVHGTSVRDEFKEHADNEREHADKIAERIQQLGGKPDFNPRTLLERSASQYVEGETLADMIREDLIAERMVVEIYQNMIRHFGSDDPTTRHMMEGILADEEEHASDLTDLLYIVEPSTGKTEGQDPGTNPLNLTRSGNADQNRRQKASPDGHNRQATSRGEKNDVSRNQESRRQQSEAKGNRSSQGRSDQRRDLQAEAGTIIGELQRREREPGTPVSAGRGQRNRGIAGPADAEGGEVHPGQQLGASRAVRQTQPNRKRRVA